MIQHWKIILSLALIFSAGVFVGHQLGSQKTSEPEKRHDHRGSFQKNVLNDLSEKLTLTPEQIGKISPIILEMENELKEVRNETFKLTKEVIDRLNAKISEELDPEQQTLFKQWHEEQRQKWKERSSGKKDEKADILEFPTACNRGRC